MSVTNAISGLTAAGGLLCLGGGFFPHSLPQFLASIAVVASSFNVAGGFLVTKRMLDMFKRKGDPVEYNYLYGLAGGIMIGDFLLGYKYGIPNIQQMGYLASSLLCIGAICGLSS